MVAFRSVLLPAPFAPIIVTIEPAPTVMDTSLTACAGPKATNMFEMARTSVTQRLRDRPRRPWGRA